MIVKPKTRGFICTTAHPVGCSDNVAKQIDYVKAKGHVTPVKNALIIGASTGYGLASRIVAAYGAKASTLGVFYERAASKKRTATAGWYNSVAFEKQAMEDGIYAKSLNGDAFSNEMKEAVIKTIKEDMGQVDLVVYSLASPKRMHPETKEVFNSVLKPIGNTYTNKTVNFHNGDISEITIESAGQEEIDQTVKVMGGEDWQLWMEALLEADVLAEGVKTVAYSYIGPEITHAVYREGTIGRAKDHLEATAGQITELLGQKSGEAYVSVNKALVTQSSSAIPVVPLYISILYKIMKEKGLHENCIEQCYRLFDDFMYEKHIPRDQAGRIRIDDYEMQADVQEEVLKLWSKVNSDNLDDLSDIQGYRDEFYSLFGFNAGLDTDLDVNVEVSHDNIRNL